MSQLEARIRSLEANKQAERGITPDLVSKLEKLTLGPKEKAQEPLPWLIYGYFCPGIEMISKYIGKIFKRA